MVYKFDVSMVLRGRRFRARLVGMINADMFGKDSPLGFVFFKSDESGVGCLEIA